MYTASIRLIMTCVTLKDDFCQHLIQTLVLGEIEIGRSKYRQPD